MPANPELWMLFIVLCALVLGVALWLGRGLSVRRTKEEFSLEIKEHAAVSPAQPHDSAHGVVSVGKDLDGDDVTIGNVTGVESAGPESAASQDVDVLSGARLKHARVGDISGVRQDGSKAQDRK